MSPEDLVAIETRVRKCLDAVNEEDQPYGRLIAWASHGAGIIRKDVPALIELVRQLAKDAESLR